MFDLKDVSLEDINAGNQEEERKYSLMGRISFALLTLALAFGVAHWVSAEPLPYAKVGWWDIDSYEGQACAAYASYEGGNQISLMVWKDGRMKAMIGNQSWKISPGVYDGVKLESDSMGAWETNATVEENATGKSFHIPLKPQLLYEIAKGRTLYIQAGKWNERFSLIGSGKAIAKTVECAKSLSNSSPFGQPKEESPFVEAPQSEPSLLSSPKIDL